MTDAGRSLSFDEAIRAHDEALESLGLKIWVGGEPTFTDRFSQEREWLYDATGPTKEARARQLVRELVKIYPDALVMRSCGRQYPGETAPRFSYGLYRWNGPGPGFSWASLVDPLMLGARDPVSSPPVDGVLTSAARYRNALARRLVDRSQGCTTFEVDGPLAHRLVFRTHAESPSKDSRWARSSIHVPVDPKEVLLDTLSQEGHYLVAFEDFLLEASGGWPTVRIELPAFPQVALFLQFIEDLVETGREVGTQVVLTGYGPPVNIHTSWLTVTPDPGVIEINMAPALDVTTHLAWYRDIWAAAAAVGLEPLRYRFNGDVADSGGGGHITLGGPTAAGSPFFLHMHLLPALVTYLNRHPALSYAFAVDSLGSSSQSPRPDEGSAELFEELAVALAMLRKAKALGSQELWAALAPFLVDHSGNTHRSEINVEKLWNPGLPVRGQLGVVELRAFRMPRTPERAAALAAMLRAIAARLIVNPPHDGLVSWGPDLHDRFSLPFYLLKDLTEILDDIRDNGFGLGERIRAELLDDSARFIGHVPLPGAQLILKQAVEFWPVLGDLTTQEGRTSRTLDASTNRVEVVLRAQDSDTLDEWHIAVNGYRLPLVRDRDETGLARVCGVRYRAFVPMAGLHPTLPAQLPLELVVKRKDADATVVTIHDWIPGGGIYDGLPRTGAVALHRREERVVVRHQATAPPVAVPPPVALSLYCLDLRRV